MEKIDFKTFENNPIHNGIQYKHVFDNNYGVSIVQHEFSYGGDRGLWELAVIGKEGQIDYKTSITNDVLGNLTEQEVNMFKSK